MLRFQPPMAMMPPSQHTSVPDTFAAYSDAKYLLAPPSMATY
jgi:hypothetical protein